MDKMYRASVSIESTWRCSHCGTLYADNKNLKKKVCEECGTKMTPMKEKLVRT